VNRSKRIEPGAALKVVFARVPGPDEERGDGGKGGRRKGGTLVQMQLNPPHPILESSPK
jgi:hypothetical protein